MGGEGSGYRQGDENKSARLYLQFTSDLAKSGILPRFAALIKAECLKTGKTAIEVIEEGLRSGPKVIKMMFLAAMELNSFSSKEAKETVDEFFRRLAKPSLRESDDDSQTGTGKSLPKCDLLDSE